MSDYLLADRAESAFVAIIKPVVRTLLDLGASDYVPVVPGKDAGDRQGYMVTIVCEAGEEQLRDTGNFWVDTIIDVQCPVRGDVGAATTPHAHDLNLLSAIHNAVYVTDLEAQLTAAVTEFTVFNSSVQRGASIRARDEEGGNWHDQIRLRFLACASDLS